MLANQLSASIDSAPLNRLAEIGSTVCKAALGGHLTEQEAEALLEAIGLRQRAGTARRAEAERPKNTAFPPRKPQPARLHPERIERRRKLALAGALPPGWREHFTTAELAVLKIIGDEIRGRGWCARSLQEIAARAGTCRTTAHTTIRKAAALGLLAITERRAAGALRNMPNLIRATAKEWRSWIARFAQKVFRKTSPTADSFSQKGRSGPANAASPRQQHGKNENKPSPKPPRKE